MNHAEALREEIARAARALGAPDDTAPVLKRPRDSPSRWQRTLRCAPSRLAEAARSRDSAHRGHAGNWRVEREIAVLGSSTFVDRRSARGWFRFCCPNGGTHDIAGERVVGFVSDHPRPLQLARSQAALGTRSHLWSTLAGSDREFTTTTVARISANLAKSVRARARLAGRVSNRRVLHCAYIVRAERMSPGIGRRSGSSKRFAVASRARPDRPRPSGFRR